LRTHGRTLRIAIDASRTTRALRTGTEHYALSLIRALIAAHTDHQFTLYFRDSPSAEWLNANGLSQTAHVNIRVIPQARLWTQIRWARALFADRPAVTFVPAHTLPVIFPGPGVVTLHDVGYHYFPQAHPRRQRIALALTTRYSAQRAARVLVDSQATADDLATLYHISPAKMRVAYPGVEGLTRADDAAIAAVRVKYALPERYLLFVGTLQPRKNINWLVEAYSRWRSTSASAIPLILAGGRGWLSDSLLLDRPGVRTLGYVPDADLAALYSGALAFLFPSLYEGFGFPAIEAMRCGTPVLCSDTSSLGEIAGDAALTVDPKSVEAIRDGIMQLVANAPLRADLIARGTIRAARFTWRSTAETVLEALEAAAAM